MPVEPFLLWVADINNVAAWTGFVYLAFVIDMFFRHIVGLRVSSSMKAELVPDALERALWERNDPEGLIYRSDRGSEYLSIGYVERLAGAGIEPIGDVPPAEFEAAYHRQQNESAMVA